MALPGDLFRGSNLRTNMKTFQELSARQQARAKEQALGRLLQKVSEGTISFPGNKDLQKKVADAAAEAERLKTPWFIAEMILDTCRDEFEQFAAMDAARAFYREPSELVFAAQ
jgi:hypothetical protein